MDSPTIDQFKQALPPSLKKSVNQELIDKINTTLSDPDMYETYREHLLSYVKVMKEGKFKVSSYIDAVKYVSHKLAGKTNKDAFAITFPDKIQDWATRGITPKDQASYITAYNKSKLVNLIMEQTLVPFWVLNQDLYQRALNVQAELMVSANSEMVRTTAANSLLTQLKPPETQKMELEVSTKENSAITALRESTLALVEQQKRMLAAGVTDAQELAHSKVVKGETLDNETGEVVE